MCNIEHYTEMLSNYDYFGYYKEFPVVTGIYKKFEVQKNIQGMSFYTGNINAPICATYIYIPDIKDIIITKKKKCDEILIVCKDYTVLLYGCKRQPVM